MSGAVEIDRNTIEGFAWRVRKNLIFMLEAQARGEDLHIVTHLANSLLGLIVFPYEQFKRARRIDFRSVKLADLTATGWPGWSFQVGGSDDLDDLLRHLRNALSHRRVRFSSDSRELAGVDITFWDRRNPDGPDDWSTSIRGDELLDFALRLAGLIEDSK